LARQSIGWVEIDLPVNHRRTVLEGRFVLDGPFQETLQFVHEALQNVRVEVS